MTGAPLCVCPCNIIHFMGLSCPRWSRWPTLATLPYPANVWRAGGQHGSAGASPHFFTEASLPPVTNLMASGKVEPGPHDANTPYAWRVVTEPLYYSFQTSCFFDKHSVTGTVCQLVFAWRPAHSQCANASALCPTGLGWRAVGSSPQNSSG